MVPMKEIFDHISYREPQPSEADRLAYQAAKEAASQMGYQTKKPLHFTMDRSLTGKELSLSLRTTLTGNNINPSDVMARYFSKSRLNQLFQTGTDRDDSSDVDEHGKVDRQVEWMRALEIFSPRMVTYVSPLYDFLTGGSDTPQTHDLVYVLYDRRQLFKVNPYASNGFHVFLTSPPHALIAAMSDKGDVPLTRVRASVDVGGIFTPTQSCRGVLR